MGQFPITILAGDLGGTKTLLGIYQWDGNLKKLFQRKYLSGEWPSLAKIINDFIKQIPEEIAKPNYGCMAVAGPVREGKAQITNLPWLIKESEICSAANINQIELINDFSVLIYGLNYFTQDQFVELQAANKNPSQNSPVAIIGAGTGLGVARGLPVDGGIVAIPSEGGHSEFSPRTEQEWHLAQWLKADLKLDRLSLERVVSGRGLGHIVRWRLSNKDAEFHPLRKLLARCESSNNKNPTFQNLPALASKAAEKGDSIMQEAIDIWLSAYGSVAGDIALQELCTGGLWIGGGTAIKQLEGLKSKIFLNSLQNKGRFKHFLETLPVKALIDPNASLFSAACRARMLI